MRLAFVGKGGAGKSVIAGTFARLLAQQDAPVVAVDSDPLPGIALSLGMVDCEEGIPPEAVEQTEGGTSRYRLRSGLSAAEALQRYAQQGPNGVRLLQFGKLRGHASTLMASQAAFRAIVADLPGDVVVIGDLPGGTRQAFFGWATYAKTIVIVVEPTAKGVLSARRLARIRQWERGPRDLAVVVNKASGSEDADNVARETGLEVIGTVPADDAVIDAERQGRALIDHCPECPSVAAIASLVDVLKRRSS